MFDLMYEPLAGSSLKNLSRLVLQKKLRIDVRNMPRMIYATALSIIMAPFLIKKSIKFNKKIQQTKITKVPKNGIDREYMMNLYVDLHEKYLKERKLIPNGNRQK